jgi:hypothetical protein
MREKTRERERERERERKMAYLQLKGATREQHKSI